MGQDLWVKEGLTRDIYTYTQTLSTLRFIQDTLLDGGHTDREYTHRKKLRPLTSGPAHRQTHTQNHTIHLHPTSPWIGETGDGHDKTPGREGVETLSRPLSDPPEPSRVPPCSGSLFGQTRRHKSRRSRLWEGWSGVGTFLNPTETLVLFLNPTETLVLYPDTSFTTHDAYFVT